MHIPVLQKEVLRYLDPKPNENFIDCTLGAGGHTLLILERTAPKGKVLGIDWDAQTLQETKHLLQSKKVGDQVLLSHGNFSHISDIAAQHNFAPVQGILMDLGFSSLQLDES